jgi:hypothetical protein
MVRRVFRTLLWLGVVGASGMAYRAGALAHDGPHCPPISVLLDFAASGRLGDAELACLPKDGPGGAGAFARWRNAWARGDRSERGVKTLGQSELSADLALDLAEVVAADFPELARAAVGRARAASWTWVNPVHRARQIDRVLALEAHWTPGAATVRWAQGLLALGVTGSRWTTARAACAGVAPSGECEKAVLPSGFSPPSPDPGEVPLRPSAIFAHAVFGRPYATERDALAAKVAVNVDPAAATAARVAMVQALDHSDKGAATIIARAVGPALAGDSAFARRAARLHREVGDELGARAWEAGIR